jgi:hypothetical protein
VRRVISALNEMASQPLRGDANRGAHLRETGAAAGAWVETLVACHAVVAFNFDPEANPGAAW